MKNLPLKQIYITSPYGMRFHPIDHVYKLHGGVDLRAVTGTETYAVDNGNVILSKWVDGAGETIVIKHSNYYAYYCHLSKRKVTVGQIVHAGQVIALTGNTGNSTGAHLHFGLCHTFNISAFSKSDWFDPMPILEETMRETKPLIIVNKRTNTEVEITDNIFEGNVNHPAIKKVCEALGYSVKQDKTRSTKEKKQVVVVE